MFGFGMVGYKNDSDHSSYSPNHTKTEPVHRNPRWQLFGRIWNGQAVRCWTAIQNPNHSTFKQNTDPTWETI